MCVGQEYSTSTLVAKVIASMKSAKCFRTNKCGYVIMYWTIIIAQCCLAANAGFRPRMEGLHQSCIGRAREQHQGLTIATNEMFKATSLSCASTVQ